MHTCSFVFCPIIIECIKKPPWKKPQKYCNYSLAASILSYIICKCKIHTISVHIINENTNRYEILIVIKDEKRGTHRHIQKIQIDYNYRTDCQKNPFQKHLKKFKISGFFARPLLFLNKKEGEKIYKKTLSIFFEVRYSSINIGIGIVIKKNFPFISLNCFIIQISKISEIEKEINKL